MSDQLLTGPKVTVGFTRKIQVRDYESAEATIFVEVPTVPGDFVAADGTLDKDALVAASKSAFFAAKSVVFEQLGLQMSVTEEGVVMEVLERELGSTVEIGAAPRTTEARSQAGAKSGGPTAGGVPAPPSSKDDLWAELSEQPKRWFDNRVGKKNPKSPDFKRKGNPAPGEKYAPGLYLDKAPEGLRIPEPSEF